MAVPLILPILIPFLTAAVSLVAWRRLALQRWLGVGGAFCLLAVAVMLLATVRHDGIQTMQVGRWPAPYGITLVADHFSALMMLVAAVIGAAVAVYSLVDIDKPRQSFAYYPLLHVLLMGVMGAFLTGDIFNLYVWFEVMLISSFVLVALGNERSQLLGGLKYVTLNLIASFLFLVAVGILYGAVGTLNMADAAGKLAALDNPRLVTTLSMLFLIAFGIKAAVFPLFFWLPASYPAPPAAVSALFAGLLTKVGVYAMIRVFTLLFTGDVPLTHTLILVLSGLTMITGVLGAIVQTQIRRILSFHIISQIGYMILGLGLFTPLGIAGSVFYIIHHILVKTNLFLVGGIIHQLRRTYELHELAGLYRTHPSLAVLFAVPALSLAGLPPLSGFVAKLSLIRAGFEVGQYAVVAVAIAVSLLTLYSMSKIWNEAFWKARPERPPHEERTAGGHPPRKLSRREWWVLAAPAVVLATLTVLMGLAAGPIYQLAQAAAHELLDPSTYIQAVLGERR
jgi:multicomponent Na+:H+ antiporter subunit D